MDPRTDFALPPRRAAAWPAAHAPAAGGRRAPHDPSPARPPRNARRAAGLARRALRALANALAALASLALAVAALALVLWAGALGSARAQPADAAETSRTLSPYFVVENAAAGAQPATEALPLKHTRADVTISGVIADVRITQVYRNEGSVPIDARYVFPASTRAAVHALRLRVGARVVDAEIREKRQARAEFAQARREGKRAALLEQQRPNVFTMAIANVMPGDELAVELRYTETIVPTDGTYRFVFPTVVGPRYNGGAGDAGRPAEGMKLEGWIAQPILRKGVPAKHRFELHARIVAPLPIGAVESPSHALRVDGLGTHEATLVLPADAAHADRDLVIDYRLAGSAIAAGLLIQRAASPADENFFLLMAEPPARVDATDVLPRDYVFILDVSGSMHGHPLDVAKTLLRDLVGRLRPSDTFNVIPFAGGSSQLAAQSLPASEENIARAIRFIDGQTGGGGTELLPALRRALALPTDHGRARTLIVVTDGYVTIEKEAFDLVRSRAGQANLFAFGIGSAVNRFLIEGLARAGKGEPFFVLDPQQAEREATRLRRMIEQPVLTRIRVRFPEGADGSPDSGFAVYDLDAPQLPDLFAQRPLVLMGKFRGEPKGTIEIEGLAAGGALRLSIDVAQAVQAAANALPGAVRPAPAGAPSGGLKYLWARSRIATLGDYTRVGSDEMLVRELTALGLKYNLLTDYTSFIAIDKQVVNPGGGAQGVDQPSPLPEGVDELAVASAPSTPEPPFALLAALAGALTWWLRRRRPAAHAAAGAAEVRHG